MNKLVEPKSLVDARRYNGHFPLMLMSTSKPICRIMTMVWKMQLLMQ